ncbi:MAG: type IV pilus secretin PilQ [Deltaproteobacteria bacterium]|nr:type IV pilus secretin PilQ [Deltaproteobacteria bacterium]
MHILDNRLRHALTGLMAAAVLLFSGCASTGPKAVNEPTPGEEKTEKAQQQAPKEENKAPEKTAVEYINVVGEGDRVLIGTTGSVRYTVFKLSDPSRLIVDMPGVNLDKVSANISVGNDFLNDITAVNYGENKEIGRLVINLKEGIDHEVKSGENSILVTLRKGGAAVDASAAVVKASASAEVKESAPVAVAQAPAEEQTPAPPAVEPAPPVAPAPEQAAPEQPALKQATKIVKIDSSKDGQNTVIKIQADGALGNFNSFELDSPSRIVVDIWGVDSALGKDLVKLKGGHIKDVRVGSHPDKARLVFDAAKAKLPPHSIVKDNDTITITIGPAVIPAEKKAQAPKESVAKAEAPAVNAAPKEPASPAPQMPAESEAKSRIESVDFRKVAGTARLTITGTAKTEHAVKDSSDGKTLVIDIKDAVISKELTRTLDASKLKTNVLSISSYQESTKAPQTVRVLVKLVDRTAYNVTEENGSVVVEFASPAEAQPAEEKAAAAKKEAPITVTGKEGAGREYTGRRIDLDMLDANITDVIRLLAEISNLNIIASDDVKGTISLRLKNVPWDQAFDIILKAKDLDSIRDGNVVRVAPALKIRQEKETALASSRAQEKLENLETEFIPVSYANADDLIPHIKPVLTERGNVTSEKRTSTLIVRDIRKGIEAAKELVKRLDKITPQVLIEARIVEAESSFARDLGIQWGADFQTGGDLSTNTFGSTATAGQTPPNPSVTPPTFTGRSGVQDFAVNLPAAGTAGPLGALGFVLGKAGSNPLIIDLRLSAGESEGKVKTISRPRISTLDNKDAKIEQGESIPFETTSASGTATQFVDANLSLTVTPHITPDGRVSMKIKASRNSIGSFRTSSGAPSINKKESSTEVLVSDNETTVIGGIVITDKSETEKGIPLLKDIPVLGWLFKSKSVSDKQTELLIFITPTIMKDKIAG